MCFHLGIKKSGVPEERFELSCQCVLEFRGCKVDIVGIYTIHFPCYQSHPLNKGGKNTTCSLASIISCSICLTYNKTCSAVNLQKSFLFHMHHFPVVHVATVPKSIVFLHVFPCLVFILLCLNLFTCRKKFSFLHVHFWNHIYLSQIQVLLIFRI